MLLVTLTVSLYQQATARWLFEGDKQEKEAKRELNEGTSKQSLFTWANLLLLHKKKNEVSLWWKAIKFCPLSFCDSVIQVLLLIIIANQQQVKKDKLAHFLVVKVQSSCCKIFQLISKPNKWLQTFFHFNDTETTTKTLAAKVAIESASSTFFVFTQYLAIILSFSKNILQNTTTHIKPDKSSQKSRKRK